MTMTRQEKAVIEAAMAERNSLGRMLDRSPLALAVDELIFSCPQCNGGGHTCPGDGNPIGHTQTDCGQHEEPDEMDKRTADTLPCWECLTDPTEDPAPWCDCREAGERCKGPCRKRAHVPERCPNLSPAWRAKQESPIHALAEELIGSPIGPVRDGEAIGHVRTDCGQHDEPDAWEVPRRPTEEEYRSLPILDPKILEPKEWVPATLVQCLAGDHIRMGADETDVVRSSAGIWHADTSDAWHPRAWKHTELRMDLSANPGFQEYPPNLACEILCSPERKAALLLQSAFPGSAVTSSDVD